MPSDYYRLATIERLSGSNYLATIWGWLRPGLAPVFCASGRQDRQLTAHEDAKRGGHCALIAKPCKFGAETGLQSVFAVL